jgi:NAD(P)-dependent dehydrogenase (short-subunit alcohol dehydrogenase family)
MLLKDKVIIVTGAGSGIGLATAVILAQAGAKVAVSGHDAAGLDDVQKRVADMGGTAVAITADVSKEADVAALVERTVSEFGRLDGAFNNAGVPMHNKLTDELDVDEWDGVMNVNLRAVFLCMKYEIKAMRKTGGGAIVNNSSVDSIMAVPRWTEYTASKHAVNGLTRGAAAEAKQTGVRVNAVLPGYIVTPMSEKLLKDPSLKEENAIALDRHSVGRFGQPEDVGYAVKWLLSDEAAFVNGAMLAVDGGFTAR